MLTLLIPTISLIQHLELTPAELHQLSYVVIKWHIICSVILCQPDEAQPSEKSSLDILRFLTERLLAGGGNTCGYWSGFITTLDSWEQDLYKYTWWPHFNTRDPQKDIGIGWWDQPNALTSDSSSEVEWSEMFDLIKICPVWLGWPGQPGGSCGELLPLELRLYRLCSVTVQGGGGSGTVITSHVSFRSETTETGW